MPTAPEPDRATLGAALLGFAALWLAASWLLPARFRSVHPAVLTSAARGTPGLLEAVTTAVGQGQPGAARWLARAAGQLGGRDTNRIAALAERRDLARIDFDAGLVASLTTVRGAETPAAFDLLLSEKNRSVVATFLEASRSPGTQALLRTRGMAVRRFVAVDRAGGQPLEAAILLTALLHERELLSPSLAADLRGLAERGLPGPNDTLEDWYVNLLVVSRRLEWSALARLVAVTPDSRAFARFALATKAFPKDLPLLYAGAVLGGNPEGVAHQLLELGPGGRAGVVAALSEGAGAVRVLAADGRPLLPGAWVPSVAARWAWMAPRETLIARCVLLVGAVGFCFAGLGQLAGISRSAPRSGWGSFALRAGGGLAVVTLLAAAGEPTPPRLGPRPDYHIQLNLAALAPPSPASGRPATRSNLMDVTTLSTIGVFAALQITVYVICRRKIDEISRLAEPALVRLRLLENEDNLFDAGLYVGIGGTATALVLQVLHLVEANLLAAYSSNLMGIITVALIKIRHVRPSKRQLILEAGQGQGQGQDQ